MKKINMPIVALLLFKHTACIIASFPQLPEAKSEKYSLQTKLELDDKECQDPTKSDTATMVSTPIYEPTILPKYRHSESVSSNRFIDGVKITTAAAISWKILQISQKDILKCRRHTRSIDSASGAILNFVGAGGSTILTIIAALYTTNKIYTFIHAPCKVKLRDLDREFVDRLNQYKKENTENNNSIIQRLNSQQVLQRELTNHTNQGFANARAILQCSTKATSANNTLTLELAKTILSKQVDQIGIQGLNKQCDNAIKATQELVASQHKHPIEPIIASTEEAPLKQEIVKKEKTHCCCFGKKR